MKLVNAYWEEINTGLKTCEITFEKGDTFQDYLDSNIENEYKFSVVKIPVGNLTLVHQLEDIGYRYLENQMALSFEVDQLNDINPKWKRLLKGFNCKLLTTKQEIGFILNEVRENMFESDRISLDPFWEAGTSSKRYEKWITDLFEKENVRFYAIVHDDKQVGFFSMKQKMGNIQSCPIAGIYNKYKSAGYIFILTWYWLIKSKENGSKKLVTSVSSNNRNILSSLSKIFSFRISETHIVLRKIVNQCLGKRQK
jgi:hypothetical protein